MNRKFFCRYHISSFYNVDSFSTARNVEQKIWSVFISLWFKIEALTHVWYFKDYLKYILIYICLKIPMYSLHSELYQFLVRRVLGRALVHESRYTIYHVLWPHFHIVVEQNKFMTIYKFYILIFPALALS